MVSKSAMFCKSLLAVCGALLPVSSLYADDFLDVIVVTGRAGEQAVDRIPGSVGVVDSDDIELVRHTHINEAADRIAGVWVSRGNGQEHLTAIRSPVVTGPGSCGVFLVLQDGIPTRPAGFCNVNQLFEINTEQASAIEVFRGPNSAIYGNNAVHGVINVISKPVGSNEKGSLMLDTGPHDYSRLFASYDDGKQLRMDFHGDHDGGFIDDSGYDQQKLSVKIKNTGESFNNQTFVEMSNLNQETAGYIEGVDVYKIDHLKNDNLNPEAYRDAQSIHGYSRFVFREGENSEWSLTPYANQSRMQFLQHFIRGTPLEKSGHESAGVTGRFNNLIAASDAFFSVSGFTLETGRAFVDQFQENPAVPPSANFPPGQHYDFDVVMNSASVFSEFEYRFLPSTTGIAGLRYDHQFYGYDNRLPANTVGVYTRPPDGDEEFGNGAVNLGLLHEWMTDQQIFINGATAFRAPQVAELYRLEGGQPPDDIESEKIHSLETGLRGSITASGSVFDYELALFDMWKDHVIFKTQSRQYIGTGETSHRGVELALGYQNPEHYFVRLSATYAEHRYEKVGAQLQGSPVINLEGMIIDTAPRYFGALQLGRAWTNGLFELEFKEMGPYYLDPEHDWQYAGHHLINARALWKINPEWKVSGRILNLTDEDYAERADVSFANLPRYFVGQPRSLYLAIEKNFY